MPWEMSQGKWYSVNKALDLCVNKRGFWLQSTNLYSGDGVFIAFILRKICCWSRSNLTLIILISVRLTEIFPAAILFRGGLFCIRLFIYLKFLRLKPHLRK